MQINIHVFIRLHVRWHGVHSSLVHDEPKTTPLATRAFLPSALQFSPLANYTVSVSPPVFLLSERMADSIVQEAVTNRGSLQSRSTSCSIELNMTTRNYVQNSAFSVY